MDAVPLALSILMQIAPAEVADTYSRFPTEQQCEASHALSVAWAESIRQEAQLFGYGCGWSRDHLADCERRRLAWWALWWVRWSQVKEQDREAWSDTLKAHIGPAAWCRGEMPSPVPR